MKKGIFLVLALIIGLISCKKDDSDIYDYRDAILGDYSGIRVKSYWIDTVVGFAHDTSSILISLTKSNLDSIIILSFNRNYSSDNLTFKYLDGQFISTTYYHGPVLTIINDSLYYKHEPGQGPYWIECFVKKME